MDKPVRELLRRAARKGGENLSLRDLGVTRRPAEREALRRAEAEGLLVDRGSGNRYQYALTPAGLLELDGGESVVDATFDRMLEALDLPASLDHVCDAWESLDPWLGRQLRQAQQEVADAAEACRQRVIAGGKQFRTFALWGQALRELETRREAALSEMQEAVQTVRREVIERLERIERAQADAAEGPDDR